MTIDPRTIIVNRCGSEGVWLYHPKSGDMHLVTIPSWLPDSFVRRRVARSISRLRRRMVRMEEVRKIAEAVAG